MDESTERHQVDLAKTNIERTNYGVNLQLGRDVFCMSAAEAIHLGDRLQLAGEQAWTDTPMRRSMESPAPRVWSPENPPTDETSS